MFWNSVQAKQSSVRMLRNKQFTNKATNRTRHWYVISHASFARLESVTAMFCKEIKLTFLILFFMIRSAAYTLSPSSILCIPSLEVGKVKNPNPKTLQSKYCDPNHCIRLVAHCNPIHILCHNTLVHTVTVQSCRANDPFSRHAAARPLCTTSLSKLK